MSLHQLKVVIVGAGIGGLATGLALRQAGYEVDVYENAPAIRPIGFGLCMWPNGAKALNALGLGAAIERVSPKLDAVEFRADDGELLSHVAMDPLEEAVGQRPYPIARADLLAALLAAFGDEHVHLSADGVRVEQDADGATAHFADGRSARGDLVVGADGIRSTVRRHVVGHDGVFNYLSAAWETVVPADPEISPSDTFTFWVGENRRAALMPIAGERAYCFFDFPPPPDHGEDGVAPLAFLAEQYGDWCEPVRQLLGRVDPDKTMPVRYHDLDALDTYVNGRVVLIGDAAHATTPTLGQGAAQATEDGLVLAHFLRTTNRSLDDALARYDAERMRRTQAIVLGARAQTQKIVAHDQGVTKSWHDELRNGSRDFVEAVEKITLAGPLR
ncbi:MAG TPA: FAD-dependent monooxygenase [Conexibacter sp.]|nr:FAD-dependent monooxygenase [Conexibacter sp.]